MKLVTCVALGILCTFFLSLACEVEGPPKLMAEPDLSVQKAGAKFKYKSEDSCDAQQGWKIGGECPTQYENFDQIPSFQIAARQEGETDSLNHFFYKDSTGIKGRDGTRYKQRFVYYKDSRNDHHRMPSYGMFKASIKDGKLKFTYAIRKANEGNLMVNMEYYDNIKETMAESNKFTAAAMIGVTLEAGSEMHDNVSKLVYKAKQKTTKAKLAK